LSASRIGLRIRSSPDGTSLEVRPNNLCKAIIALTQGLGNHPAAAKRDKQIWYET